MEKVPEKFELIFYDENMSEIKDHNYKVEPLKLLIIKRIPFYKLLNTFVECIRDPGEIGSLRFSELIIPTKTNIITDPLDKLQLKLSHDIINQHFTCKLCNKTYDESFVILCCGESICEKCIRVNSRCPYCNTELKFMPNRNDREFKEKLNNILNKQITEPIVTSPHREEAKIPKLIPVQTNEINPHSILFENTRFFVIKSSNKDNVEISQKHNEWATTVTNQRKLNEAFQSKDVILIFSVNKSGLFQGYAIMTSFISDKVSTIWQNEYSVKLGGSFSIHWLCICEMPFSKVKNLTNSLNNHEPIIKSRDTQELPKDIGVLLCNYCYEQEKFENSIKTTKPNYFESDTLTKIYDEIKRNREST